MGLKSSTTLRSTPLHAPICAWQELLLVFCLLPPCPLNHSLGKSSAWVRWPVVQPRRLANDAGTKAKIQRRHKGALCHGNSWCNLQTPCQEPLPAMAQTCALDGGGGQGGVSHVPSVPLCSTSDPPDMLVAPCLCSGPAAVWAAPGAPRCVGCAGECLGRVPKWRQRHPAIRLLNPVVQSCNAHTHRSMHVP